MFGFFRYSKNRKRNREPSTVLLCSFGDAPTVREDDTIYREFGLNILTEQFAGIDDFARFMAGREVPIIHAFIHPDNQGDVPDLPAADFFDCLLDSQTSILVVASENPADNTLAFIQAKRGWFDELGVIHTIDRRGEYFKAFIVSLFALMFTTKKSLPEAWVAIAPQGKQARHEGLPATLLTY